jgi:hypothetical protein
LRRKLVLPGSIDWMPDRPICTVVRRWPGGSQATVGGLTAAYRPDDLVAFEWRDSVDGKIWEIYSRCTADPGIDPGHREGIVCPGFYPRVLARGPMHKGTKYEQDCWVPSGQPNTGFRYWLTTDRGAVTDTMPIYLATPATSICMHVGYGPQVGNNSDACLVWFNAEGTAPAEFAAARAAFDAMVARGGSPFLDVGLIEVPNGDDLFRLAA